MKTVIKDFDFIFHLSINFFILAVQKFFWPAISSLWQLIGPYFKPCVSMCSNMCSK